MFPPLTHLLHHSTSFPLSTMCTISFHLIALIVSPLTHLSNHAMHNHPCLLHYFWFHASKHWIIALNCCTFLVPFTYQISYNFYLHYMHSLMHHPPHLESHAMHHESCCTFDSFLHHSTSLSFLYHVHNHSCSLAATVGDMPWKSIFGRNLSGQCLYVWKNSNTSKRQSHSLGLSQ